MQYDDYELVYMIREDEEMLSYMLKKYEPLFRKLAYSFVKSNPRKGLDVEDLVQQCRITTCYAIDRYNESNDILFYSYLLVCLKRGILNFSRKYLSKPDSYSYMEFENYENSSEFIDNFDTFEVVGDDLFQSEIIDFKHSLKDLDAAIFELRYNGFSYKEIATLLDINLKKVGNSLLQIRKKILKYFLF